MTKFTYKNLYRAASERLTIGEPTAGVLESAEIVVQVRELAEVRWVLCLGQGQARR